MNPTKRKPAISILIGLAYLLFILHAPKWVHGTVTLNLVPYRLFSLTIGRQLQVWSMYPGIILLGAGATYAYLTRRYILPGLVVLLPFFLALWVEFQSDAPESILLGLPDLYRLYWFVIFGAALVALGLERSIRRVQAARAGTAEVG
jgi:hypothetical protein